MTALNATYSGINSLASFGNFGVILTIIITATILLILTILLSNKTTMRWLLAFAKFLRTTFGNFVIGLITLIILVPIGWFIKINVGQAQAGNPIILKGIGIALAVYAVISLIGWLIKNVLRNVTKTYKAVKR